MPTVRSPWFRWAALGFLGAILVAPLPFAVGYLPDPPVGVLDRNAPWVRHATGRHLARILAIAGSLLLFVCWWQLRPAEGRVSAPLARIAAAWSVPFWLIPPLMTADAYAYAAQGWLLHTGRSPYEYGMGFPGPFADSVYYAWQHTTAVYPPLALHLQHLIVDLTGADPYWSAVGMRAIAVAGVALMGLMAVLLARQVGVHPGFALWFVLLNPLVLVQFIGGAHNDALMVGLIMVAVWLAGRASPLWVRLLTSAVTIGLAAAVKQPAVLAGLGIMLYAASRDSGKRPSWPRLAGCVAIGGALGGVTFLLLSIPGGLGVGWQNDSSGSPSMVINHSPVSWVAQLALRWGARPGIVDMTLTVATSLLIVAAVIWLTWRWGRSHPLRVTAGALLAFGLLGPAIQPWYVLWGGPLLPFTKPSEPVIRLSAAVVLLLLVSGVLQEFWSPVITVPLGGLLAFAWWRTSARSALVWRI